MHILRKPPEFDVFPSYRGGHTVLYGGYVHEFCPTHPLRNTWGWVPQHRLIGEDIVGRPLRQSHDPKVRECVHHKDENKTNNAISNLEVMTFSQHRSHHTRKMCQALFEKRNLQREDVAAALSKMSIRDAALSLGMTHMTLRKHFHDLVAPRKRKSPVRLDAPTKEELEIVRRYALDPNKSLLDCKRDAHMAERTIGRLCRKMNIKWVPKAQGLRKSYGGKPTRTWLAACASKTEPENQ